MNSIDLRQLTTHAAYKCKGNVIELHIRLNWPQLLVDGTPELIPSTRKWLSKLLWWISLPIITFGVLKSKHWAEAAPTNTSQLICDAICLVPVVHSHLFFVSTYIYVWCRITRYFFSELMFPLSIWSIAWISFVYASFIEIFTTHSSVVRPCRSDFCFQIEELLREQVNSRLSLSPISCSKSVKHQLSTFISTILRNYRESLPTIAMYNKVTTVHMPSFHWEQQIETAAFVVDCFKVISSPAKRYILAHISIKYLLSMDSIYGFEDRQSSCRNCRKRNVCEGKW